LNIDLNGNSDEKIPVSVLDCDTITQVKHKCITAIYKNKPASEVPTPHELELGWYYTRVIRIVVQLQPNQSQVLYA
jgi:plexin A